MVCPVSSVVEHCTYEVTVLICSGREFDPRTGHFLLSLPTLPLTGAWIVNISFSSFMQAHCAGRNIEKIRIHKQAHRYSEEQKITEFGLSNISDAFSNFSFSSEFPITFAAIAICLSNSPNLRKTRMTLPSKISVSWNTVDLLVAVHGWSTA